MPIPDSDVVLVYSDELSADYFEDFRNALRANGLELSEEAQESSPQSALEWAATTAIAVYIAKKLIDKSLERASEDIAAHVYPAFRKTLVDLVQKVLVRDRQQFHVVSRNKVINSPVSLILGIYSVTRSGQRVKFIFHEELSEPEYADRIEQLLLTLECHYCGRGQDPLEEKGNNNDGKWLKTIYLIYDRNDSKWKTVDPIAEARKNN